MHILFVLLLILHFIGIGSLLGGFMTQMSLLRSGTARVNPAMFHGAMTMLVSGLLMIAVGAIDGRADQIDVAKMVVKTLVLLAIIVLVLRYRKRDTAPTPVVGTIGALTIANIAIAVAWG